MDSQLARFASIRTMFAALLLVVTLSSAAAAAINALNLGARFDEAQAHLTFRVYSSRATRIDLYLYAQPTGAPEVASVPLTKDEPTAVWSTTLPVSTLRTQLGLTGTIYYGYRAWGPNWPFTAAWTKGSAAGFLTDVDPEGNRFNPNKLLLDPYAREVSHDPVTPAQPDGTIYASGPEHRTTDTGPQAPKGIVLPTASTSTGTKPTRPLQDDIIYEVHVRGLTKNDPSIPEAFRGTYRGAALKAAYLKDLGVTAVEFLPVQETQNDTNDVDPCHTQSVNYWGYATLNYFAPDRHYAFDHAPGGPTKEFQSMVKAYHDAGLKVFIDVVYNHTGEGGAHHAGDPRTYTILSWRGLDNPTYYSLTNDRQFAFDNTGVGGNYNTFNPIAQDLIVDSLAWWRDTLGVDGFRFDLAPVLGNTCEHGCFRYDKVQAGTALNRIVRELEPRAAPGEPGVALIAEPWAIGDGTFQLGNFPTGWAEWNGRYRDTLRQSQNKLGSAPITPGQLAMRFAGSADLFEANGRRPWHSINFMVAHDGFTLADLYRFNAKHNQQPCPFGPSDGGTDENNSWDQGGVAAEQRKAARNGLAFVMLSAGTPMITGGDEFLRTLQGNNNPYNLDTSADYLNFDWDAHQKTFDTFAQRLIAFRTHHPALRPEAFYTAEQVQWFKPDGSIADPSYFNNPDNHAIAWRIEGSTLHDPSPALYIAYNGWSGTVNFTLPPPGNHRAWFRVMDTSTRNEGPNSVVQPGAEVLIGGESTVYSLEARAVLLLIAK
jgi:glycogen operon protein